LAAMWVKSLDYVLLY